MLELDQTVEAMKLISKLESDLTNLGYVVDKLDVNHTHWIRQDGSGKLNPSAPEGWRPTKMTLSMSIEKG